MAEVTLKRLRPLMDSMAQCAMAAYPNEGCGVVVDRDGQLDVVCCENIQDRLHRSDPTRYPQTAQAAYHLDPMVLCDLEGTGAELRVIFHSHPDRGAYFSDEDVVGALGCDAADVPIWPRVDYLVLSARANGVDDAKLFRWSSESNRYEEHI